MKKNKFLMYLFFMLVGILTLGFASTNEAAEKTYKIGTDLTFAPFEFQDSSGEYVGVDVDLINEIAKEEGFKIDLRPLGFDSSIQGVQSNQLDGMIAGMSVTKEREKTFDFSDSYFDGGIQMAIQASDNEISSYDDLSGKTVAAKVGTQSASFLEENQDKYGYSIKNYDAADAMYNALNNNNVQAIFDDYPVLGYAITSGQDFKLVGDQQESNPYAFAVKKGENSELLKKFNAGLKKLKASGKYDEILNEYISTGSDNATTTSSSVSEMKKITPLKDSYTVVSDSAFAPFEYEDADGVYKGIDVDLLTRIAELQGFTLDMKYIGFSAALQSLDSGQGDGMIAGMTMTDERKANYDFSDSYFDSGIQLAVAEDNDDIKSYDDLAGKTVGAKVGTESSDWLQSHAKEYDFDVKNFDTADQLYDAVKVGSIDAMMDDYPVIGYAINQGQALKTPIERESGGQYGFAVKKGSNPELIEMFNEGLKELKQTGEYDEIVNTYIGNESSSENSNADSVDESTIWGLIKNNYPALLEGLWNTIVLALVSFALALILGVIFGLFRVSPIGWLRTIAGIYIDIIRGIPMMVLAFFIFFGLPGMTGITIPDFAAGIITLTLNASAYIAEIVRGGINAVPVGQMEASRSLGLGYNKTMQKIVLPQAVKIMIPSFINQFVISLKDTTIISAIGVVELLQTGKIIVARTTQSSYVYLIIAIMYLVLITILTKLANRLDKKVK
ncbi:amino acid ABC transporter substrate-binding protein/permease [Enterococcus alishanensis]|uniref:Amino acid ABC transporter substrate-binding protein/permease n=1 Tax=Enterococcus alishanensis TaxID=1303817 RepID=A0ABS6TBU6_9ENTE|nr:amino acid ABC transporter substrate-binding protein/permease [Enterococcus alishanensis]MBV7390379.1 amino acid ABC transporter substrate-binding protein/permease [Enterococcus alishanensis]